MKALIYFFSTFLSLFVTVLPATPSQVILIRHGEKNEEGNLSKRGLERAGALAPYFAKTKQLLKFGEPEAIFAARPTLNTPPFDPDENTERCLQTVGPTAELLSQPIHAGFAKFQEKEIAEFILNFEEYNEKNVIICWHHSRIQNLAKAFGVTSAPPFPDVFDQTWVITFSPKVKLKILQQQLLFGDSP